MRRIEEIIIHHSASKDVSAATIDKWHKQRGFKKIGYHYVIRQYGTIELGRDIREVGAHAKGRNSYSIGICLTGDFTKKRPSYLQICALMSLLINLKMILSNIMTVSRHHQLCPGYDCMEFIDEAVSAGNVPVIVDI